ncbi:MAG: phosphotriesterase [Actinomycetia bacterium]|nr:phosphotriesterase [Actinomycetes bacterium]
MMINTATGPVAAAELGPTFMHEHVCCADWSMRMSFGARFFSFDQVADAAVALYTKMRDECGVTTVVDGTPINLGRDPRLIRAVSERTGVRFVVSSGFYYQMEPGLMFRPEDEIVELLAEECEHGIEGTGIRPRIMKTAVDVPGLTPYLRKILSAVGRVAARAGLPLFCHHNPALGDGGDILDIFEGVGVAPERVILGHSGDSDDLDYLRRMLDRGCYLGMDRFGYCDITLSMERRVAAIAALCAEGWAHRMFLSHDLAAYLAMGGGWDPADATGQSPDYTLIHTQVRPALAAAGVSQAVFDQMMVDNPARFFTGD